MAGISEGPPIRHTIATSPYESCEQYVRGKTLQPTTIEMLPEDTLLDIFNLYRLDPVKQSRGRPWNWLFLAHVCRRWRYVMTLSPRRLGLQILCKSRVPIEPILDSWPTLPLLVRYKGPKSKSRPDNIIIALRRPDRVREIDLVLTSSITGSIIKAIQEPFQALKSIRITVKDATGPSLPIRNPFLGGSAPLLREIKLDGIAFPLPEIRQVLLSTNNLVELHLSGIPHDLYFSPDDLVTSLSTLVQLDRLTIGFYSPASFPPSSMKRPPPRTTLPSLTFLQFHGASEYLEEFLAQIDLPALCKITIKLFNQIFFEIPRFCQLIPRLDGLRSPSWVIVTRSVDSIGVLFVQEGSNESFFLGTSCRRLDWQLSFVTQILTQLSPLLSSVRSLSIKKGHQELPIGEESVDSTQWLELFQPFTNVMRIDVWEKQLVPGIVQALTMEDMAAGVLPELSSLRLSGYRGSPSVWKAARKFVVTRELSGRTVTVFD